jgi:predicted hydrocarbon binding protein
MATRKEYFQSNRITRIYLDALGEIIGRHGLSALLRLAKLSRWIESPPPYDEQLAVDFVDFTALNETLEEMYGVRGGRALALRAGRVSFHAILEQLGAQEELEAGGFHELPLPERITTLLQKIAGVMAGETDAKVWVSQPAADRLLYHLEPSASCWARTHMERPVCHSTMGLLLEAIEWAAGEEEYMVEEVSCAATGNIIARPCVFAITHVPT